MGVKKITFSLLVLSVIGWGVGIFLLKFYSCGYSVFCYNLITRSFALYYGMPALAIIFLTLMFLPSAFLMWKKFAVWFIPIATLIFIFYPNPGSGDLFSPYPEQVFRWISSLYVIISIFVIAWSVIKQKNSLNK